MGTKFKLIFEGKPDLELDKFQRSLPSIFRVEGENDGIYVTVESSLTEDKLCQDQIDRELDRHFFLTCVKIKAEMVRKTVSNELHLKVTIHGYLPKNIHPQKWNDKLPLQLRLWSIAMDSTQIVLKLILLFQIIELSYPQKSDYPEYTDPTKPPHPLTECKCIRHLVAHAGTVSHAQLKNYCEYIGVGDKMLDITDEHY
jgi:hypothetical protein